MNILVIGSGGREHAIIKKLKESKNSETIFAIPGNSGMEDDAICENIDINDFPKIASFCKHKNIEFVVVAPDDPLAKGMVDYLEENDIPCFGPTKKAAMIESSKVFSKDLMKKYEIPTAKYEVFDDMNTAISYLKNESFPQVIKADGLALGKGVIIAENFEEGKKAIKEIMEDKVFGESGNKIVIEEFLTGPEVSVLAFTDGKTVVPMISSMDHKKALDNDKGLNTGGMGTIAPNPYYTCDIAKICMDDIFIKTISAMQSEDRAFKGCLYFGLMLTEKGPKVIEYNARFGDPETQVVLPLLESDLLEIMMATRDGNLSDVPVKFSDDSACCVILASKGYPESYEKGFEISVPKELDCDIYMAGVSKNESGKLVTNGGRVMGVTAVSDTLKKAIDKAYMSADKISFQNKYFRTDIGEKAYLKIERDGE